MRVHKTHHTQAHTPNLNFTLRAGWHCCGQGIGTVHYQFILFPVAYSFNWPIPVGVVTRNAIFGSQQVDWPTLLNANSM